MTKIILAKKSNPKSFKIALDQVRRLGCPTIRVFDAGGVFYAFEGTHDLLAAEALEVFVPVRIINSDRYVDISTIDWNVGGWFDLDKPIVKLDEFIDVFTDRPLGQIEVVEVQILPR